ncbi:MULTISPECIES: sugar ABC transporter substrate-binding protein [Thermoanaerobacterium]|uniref:Extracellular solute-binding protein n=2 Tax=Thermoanaerobacterium TaxID=28895 RepID=W9EA73_9THEO|nr:MULTISPECIES: sugar ABC transporter substrate-binding protein [Thermoanaerobacterium]AFK87262.1 extracellular solute-binding protein family 1 [Thermoanaerobacterium saccharolyticum JW/SL-YS485]ETO37840.1 extracellular solute-binding protein [Thermoanaerobacterium aotearoense SCUT27]WHE06402.1 sugar ABC transporter substrate-binding protein [Thermoanaerobacterium thermosaccharolyticum]
MFKKIIVTVLAVILTIGALTGCSSSTNSSGSSNTQLNEQNGTKEKVTLNVWIMPNSPSPDKDFLDVVKPFTDTHPNINVKVTVIDWGSAWTKITTAATSGEAPDVVQLGTTWVAAISSMGALEDLTSKISEVGGASVFLPSAWTTTGIKNSGVTTAIPWFVDTRGIFYRKDVFEKAGIDPKQGLNTWDSMLETAKKINNIDINGKKIAALGIPGKNDWNVLHNVAPWIWEAGGDLLTPDDQQAAFNNDTALKGLDFYTNFAVEGLVPKATLEKNTADIESNFANGDYAMIIDGPWMIKNFETPSDKGGMGDSPIAKDYGVVPLPQGPAGRFSYFGGSDLAIFKSSKNKNEAFELIKYLVSKEAQVAYSKVSGQLPAVKEAFNDPFIANDPNRSVFKEIAEYGRSYPAIPAWGSIENIMVKHIGTVWDDVAGVNGKFNPNMIKNEMDRAAEEVNGALKQSQ